MKKSLKQKVISLILVFTMVVSSFSIAFASTDKYEENNTTCSVMEDSSTTRTIQCNEEGVATTIISLDKESGNISIDSIPSTADSIATHYDLLYYETEDGEVEYQVIDASGNPTTIDPASLALTAPVWMGLSAEAVAALIAAAKALQATVITTAVFVLAEEVINNLVRQSENYFEAYVDTSKHLVFIGDSITRTQAITTIGLNSSSKAVFCRTKSIASTLANRMGGIIDCDNEYCVTIGQWPHYHCYDAPNAHIFFPN